MACAFRQHDSDGTAADLTLQPAAGSHNESVTALRQRFESIRIEIDRIAGQDGLTSAGLPCMDECIRAVDALVAWYDAQTPDDLPLLGNAHHIRYIMGGLDGIIDWSSCFVSKEFSKELTDHISDIDEMADAVDRVVSDAFKTEEGPGHVRYVRRPLSEDLYADIEEQMLMFTGLLSHLSTRLQRLRKWAGQALWEQQLEPSPQHAASPCATSTTAPIISYAWARQVDLVNGTNQVLGEGTLNKTAISRACRAQRLQTNGRSGRALRVSVASFLVWLGRRCSLAHDEQLQIRNAIVGELIARGE